MTQTGDVLMEHIHRRKKRKGDEEIISEIRKTVLLERDRRKEKIRLQTLRKAFLSIKRTLMSTGDYEISYDV
jgi:hypothetical protein